MQWDLDLVLHEALTRNDLLGFLHALSSAGIQICSSFWQLFDLTFILLKMIPNCIFKLCTYMYAVVATPSLKMQY